MNDNAKDTREKTVNCFIISDSRISAQEEKSVVFLCC